MRIPDFAEQMKIMRMGMRCFIDLKAKKKDNMGIEYPVVNELTANSTTSNPPPPEGEPRAAFDPKKYRESFMMNMIFLKLFGFDDMEEDKKQSLVMKNNVNIYFEWDAANVMHLEYRVPLKMLMDKGPLQGREISLGWKINGVEIQSTTTTSTAPGARTGRRSTPTRPSRPVSSQQTVDKMMKDQFIWTKYVFKLK
jgi:hypothetical protein